MKYDSNERIIKNALDTIRTPEYDITAEVEKKIKSLKYPFNFKKVISIALGACLCLILSISVMAQTTSGFNKLLSIISPDIALMLEPIESISEDNGIKMEVIGAMNDDEMAVIYITMQDLTENRIDETLDIYDYSLAGAHMFNSQIVHYDKASKTATLRIQANGGKELSGKKLRWGIRSFLSHKQVFNAVDTGINLSDINNADSSQMIPLDMNNIPGGGGDLFEEFQSQGIIDVLKTDQMNIKLPKIDFMYISNIGYIDGRLHIQTKWTRDGVDDHGYLYFVDALGNKIDMSESNIYFGTDSEGNTEYGNEYIEYIFDVTNINLSEVKLMGYFVSNGNYITGNWETTFKIRPAEEKRQSNCNIKFDTWTVNSVSVSPMGVTLIGSGNSDRSLEEITVSIHMTDDSIRTFDAVSRYTENEELIIKCISSLPLDISMVKSVIVDGTIINFD
ncbi:DUF4179 domain-containing protein [Petroclostridium sp. X23]|uniref:DUF4179 domain-containing protein n=1 Tax=Petroclostridium sp. X23 TaxID=3045146 RepID=UPI0024AE75B1|nr:DUF4179 domain-containing protein [Petroclostridium sp. X23]WHH58665.1 DUF4179 domain-containing protein [Petroclostridium sp. X23]